MRNIVISSTSFLITNNSVWDKFKMDLNYNFPNMEKLMQ